MKALGHSKQVMRAVIEISRGDNRRRHLRQDRKGFVDLGPIPIPVNHGKMPVHYGYLLGTYNTSDGDEVDVLVISQRELSVGQEVDVTPVALIKRDDGDDKVVAVDATQAAIHEWSDVPLPGRTLILNFFGYHYRILAIENAQKTWRYIRKSVKSHAN